MNPLTSAPERLFAEFFFGAAMTAIAMYLTFFLYLLVFHDLSRMFWRKNARGYYVMKNAKSPPKGFAFRARP